MDAWPAGGYACRYYAGRVSVFEAPVMAAKVEGLLRRARLLDQKHFKVQQAC